MGQAVQTGLPDRRHLILQPEAHPLVHIHSPVVRGEHDMGIERHEEVVYERLRRVYRGKGLHLAAVCRILHEGGCETTHTVAAVAAVLYGEVSCNSVPGAVQTDDPGQEGIQRRDDRIPHPRLDLVGNRWGTADKRLDAAVHLECGLAGEREGEYLVGIRKRLGDKTQEADRQHGRLAASGSGRHDGVPVAEDGCDLLLVQLAFRVDALDQ